MFFFVFVFVFLQFYYHFIKILTFLCPNKAKWEKKFRPKVAEVEKAFSKQPLIQYSAKSPLNFGMQDTLATQTLSWRLHSTADEGGEFGRIYILNQHSYHEKNNKLKIN